MEHQAALRLQSFWRGCRQRREYRRLTRQHKQRESVIRELLITEENYLQDLRFVQKEVREPLRGESLLTEEESRSIFCNLDKVVKLNRSIFAELRDALNRSNEYWLKLQTARSPSSSERVSLTLSSLLRRNTESLSSSSVIESLRLENRIYPYARIFTVFRKESGYFQAYSEYLGNYPTATLVLQAVLQRKPVADRIEAALKTKRKSRQFQLQSYLIKPVQRLPKYELLLVELLKHTQANHPDRMNIEYALDLFRVVNRHTDKVLQRRIDRAKLAEICETVTMKEHEQAAILSSEAKYLNQFNVTLLQKRDIEGRVYLFSSLVLVTSLQLQQTLLKLITVEELYLIDNSGSRLYQNVLFLRNREETCAVQFRGEADRKIFARTVAGEVSSCSDRSLRLDKEVDVLVQGTQERSQGALSRYTVYVIEVRLAKVSQRLVLRYSQLLQLQQSVEDKFGFRAQHHRLQRQGFMSKLSPKIIQRRKISIKLFLEELLSSRITASHADKLLQLFGLDKKGLLQQPVSIRKVEVYSKKAQSPRRTSPTRASSPGKKRTQCTAQIEQAIEQGQGHFYRQSMSMSMLRQPSSFRQSISGLLKVRLYLCEVGEQRMQCFATTEVRAEELTAFMTKELKLASHRDYRLLAMAEDGSYWLLDPDQPVLKNKARLYLYKLLWLDQDLQMREIAQDSAKLTLVVKQFFWEIKLQRILLSRKQLVVVLTLYFCIQGSSPSLELARKLLPHEAIERLSWSEWQAKLSAFKKVLPIIDCSSKAASSLKLLQYLSSIQKLTFSFYFVSFGGSCSELAGQGSGWLALSCGKVLLLKRDQTYLLRESSLSDVSRVGGSAGQVDFRIKDQQVELRSGQSWLIEWQMNYYLQAHRLKLNI